MRQDIFEFGRDYGTNWDSEIITMKCEEIMVDNITDKMIEEYFDDTEAARRFEYYTVSILTRIYYNRHKEFKFLCEFKFGK